MYVAFRSVPSFTGIKEPPTYLSILHSVNPPHRIASDAESGSDRFGIEFEAHRKRLKTSVLC